MSQRGLCSHKILKMYVTSSATASGDCDVPSAEVIFRDKLCLISIVRRHGTLMDASSISEEDIIEICIKKGHTHPLGVLCYSATESVVLFCTTDKLKCATLSIIEIMEFQGEAITVRAMAPSEAHVTAYIVTLHKSPSNREKEPQTSPQQTPPSGGTPHHLQAELGDLDDHELHQVMEDLTQEIVQCEIHVPPAIPLQTNGYAHQAVGTPRKMTGRSPFQEGKGGVQQGNPLHLQNWSDQLEVGFPLDHPHEHHVLQPQDQTWGN